MNAHDPVGWNACGKVLCKIFDFYWTKIVKKSLLV